jgi:hypothetical protein
MLMAALMLVQAGAAEPPIEPPKEPLVCRYDSFVSRLVTRRKMCLTPTEWEQRARQETEAARRSVYELMGNTACLEGGMCTSE